MGDGKQRLVTRADIARLTGVSRPAVTNWARRHEDFPAPAGEQGDDRVEVFCADEVAAWLDTRAVPANARQPGEAAGTTFGDRFRAEPGGPPGPDRADWAKAFRNAYDPYRADLTWEEYLTLMPGLLFTRLEKPELWRRYTADARFALEDQQIPWRLAPDLFHPLLDVVERTIGGNPADGPAAFDQVLALLRDTENQRAAEFFTPSSVTQVMALALVPESGAVNGLHDPFCRSGELLTSWLEAAARRGLTPPRHISGRTPNSRARSWARMAVALRGVNAMFSDGAATPLAGPTEQPGTFDRVLSNPPFNVRMPDDATPAPHRRYGKPSTRGSNFDWLQYAVSLLTPEGMGAMVMPPGAAFTTSDGAIRRGMVEDGAVEAVVALPTGLFAGTGIAVHLWFLRHPTGRADEVLFVDGGELGSMVSRTRRALSGPEVDDLVGEVTAWRRGRSAGTAHRGTPGLSRAVSVDEIAQHGFRLDPAFLVHQAQAPSLSAQDVKRMRERVDRLTPRLRALHEESVGIDRAVTERLEEYGL
ncbi:N-6 DNA methylase [Streptomyces uncialis]|uniref:N-6 DNA methylase n=1 Tax=Streptomyces uncialis TaxID=1048205 RepID=UPI00386A69C4|nr:SAM-dependent methyltransferase [Streptomyces uncialis]